MFSSKDAFRNYNSSKNGRMNMEEFLSFLRYVYKVANKPMPPLIVSRNIF